MSRSRRHPGLVLAVLALLGLVASGPRRARAADRDEWPGFFQGDFGFFLGGGAGGGLARSKRPEESRSRYAATLPLNLRAGFDIGRYGLAVLIDTQYSFLWGPSRDQGPRPATRVGTFQMLAVSGSVLFRPLGPLYLAFGVGGAFPSAGQDMFENPAGARVELLAAIGFVYRFPRKRADEQRGPHWPFGLSVSIESRYYVPWDERFLNYSIQAVMTFYFVFDNR